MLYKTIMVIFVIKMFFLTGIGILKVSAQDHDTAQIQKVIPQAGIVPSQPVVQAIVLEERLPDGTDPTALRAAIAQNLGITLSQEELIATGNMGMHTLLQDKTFGAFVGMLKTEYGAEKAPSLDQVQYLQFMRILFMYKEGMYRKLLEDPVFKDFALLCKNTYGTNILQGNGDLFRVAVYVFKTPDLRAQLAEKKNQEIYQAFQRTFPGTKMNVLNDFFEYSQGSCSFRYFQTFERLMDPAVQKKARILFTLYQEFFLDMGTETVEGYNWLGLSILDQIVDEAESSEYEQIVAWLQTRPQIVSLARFLTQHGLQQQWTFSDIERMREDYAVWSRIPEKFVQIQQVYKSSEDATEPLTVLRAADILEQLEETMSPTETAEKFPQETVLEQIPSQEQSTLQGISPQRQAALIACLGNTDSGIEEETLNALHALYEQLAERGFQQLIQLLGKECILSHAAGCRDMIRKYGLATIQEIVSAYPRLNKENMIELLSTNRNRVDVPYNGASLKDALFSEASREGYSLLVTQLGLQKVDLESLLTWFVFYDRATNLGILKSRDFQQHIAMMQRITGPEEITCAFIQGQMAFMRSLQERSDYEDSNTPWYTFSHFTAQQESFEQFLIAVKDTIGLTLSGFGHEKDCMRHLFRIHQLFYGKDIRIQQQALLLLKKMLEGEKNPFLFFILDNAEYNVKRICLAIDISQIYRIVTAMHTIGLQEQDILAAMEDEAEEHLTRRLAWFGEDLQRLCVIESPQFQVFYRKWEAFCQKERYSLGANDLPLVRLQYAIQVFQRCSQDKGDPERIFSPIFTQFLDQVQKEYNMGTITMDSIFELLSVEQDFRTYQDTIILLKQHAEKQEFTGQDFFLFIAIAKDPQARDLYMHKENLLSALYSLRHAEYQDIRLPDGSVQSVRIRVNQAVYRRSDDNRYCTEEPDYRTLDRLSLMRIWFLLKSMTHESVREEWGNKIRLDYQHLRGENIGDMKIDQTGIPRPVLYANILNDDAAANHERNPVLSGGVFIMHGHNVLETSAIPKVSVFGKYDCSWYAGPSGAATHTITDRLEWLPAGGDIGWVNMYKLVDLVQTACGLLSEHPELQTPGIPDSQRSRYLVINFDLHYTDYAANQGKGEDMVIDCGQYIVPFEKP